MDFVQEEEEELVEVRLVDKDEKTEYILKISPADVIKAQNDKIFLEALQKYARANSVKTNIDEVSSATDAMTNLPSKTGTFSTQSNLVQASEQHTNQTSTMKWKRSTSNQKNQLAGHLKIPKLSAQTNINAENGPIGPIRLAPKTSNTSKATTVKPKLISNVLLQNVPKMKTIVSTNKSYSNVMSNNYRQANVADKSANEKLVNIFTTGNQIRVNTATTDSENTRRSDATASLDQDRSDEINEDEESLGENFRWSHEAVLLLLEEFRYYEKDISSGKMTHKKAWDKISDAMNKKGYMVTGRQCTTRYNTMKRTYKGIKDHNNKSGNNKRTWPYYEIMDSLFGAKPYMAPISTMSSTGIESSNVCSNSSSNSSSNSCARAL